MADLSNVELDLVDSVAEASRFMTWLSQRRPGDIISVDTETGEIPGNDPKDALSPWHGRLRLVQVGDGQHGWAIPWDGWNGVFHEAMSRYTGELIFHNIAFEARWFALQSKFDVPWSRCHDTMIQAQVIDPTQSAALKRLTAQYVDSRAAALQATLDTTMTMNGWTWGTVPIQFREYWAYGALDTVLTTRLHEYQYAKVRPGTPYAAAYDLEMAARRVTTRMELTGARVDLKYCQEKYDELHDFGERVRDWAKAVHKISIGSNVQLARKFLELGVEWDPEAYTPSGQAKVDKEQLQRIVINASSEAAKELAEMVLKQRKADKLATTYLQNLLTRNVGGIVHPSIRTMGARTSRMSITDPALQTLHKSEATIRRAFIPENDDLVMVSSDLDQVEFRLFANLAGDPELIRLFNDADADPDPLSGDAFTYIMREVYNDASADKRDKRRKLIKGMIYGRLYGAGIAKQALTAGVPETQMREVADAFDARYPGVNMFARQVEDAGMRRLRSEGQAYVLSKYGRRLPCDDTRVYTLVNYLIQGSAAEVFKANLLKLDAAGLGDFMIVPVHDEIVMQVPRGDVADIAPVIVDCMTTRDGYDIPLTSGFSGPGANWGELLE